MYKMVIVRSPREKHLPLDVLFKSRKKIPGITTFQNQ
jgi:hypothetical protein